MQPAQFNGAEGTWIRVSIPDGWVAGWLVRCYTCGEGLVEVQCVPLQLCMIPVYSALVRIYSFLPPFLPSLSLLLLLIPSLKRPPLREKVSLQEELAVERAPEFPVLETVAVRTAQEEKKDSYELRVAMTQLSQWTPRLSRVSRVVCMCYIFMSCVHAAYVYM